MKIDAVAEAPLKDYLEPHEVVLRRNYDLRLKFTNIGTETFPAGKLSQFNITYGDAVSSDVLLKVNPVIPKLSPQQPVEVFNITNLAQYSGIAWVRLQIVANDNNPIEYYQAGGFRIGLNEWIAHFYVLTRAEITLLRIFRCSESKGLNLYLFSTILCLPFLKKRKAYLIR